MHHFHLRRAKRVLRQDVLPHPHGRLTLALATYRVTARITMLAHLPLVTSIRIHPSASIEGTVAQIQASQPPMLLQSKHLISSYHRPARQRSHPNDSPLTVRARQLLQPNPWTRSNITSFSPQLPMSNHHPSPVSPYRLSIPVTATVASPPTSYSNVLDHHPSVLLPLALWNVFP